MTPPRVTLRDVSRLANVSPMTASRVLNGSANDAAVKQSTRQVVLKAAKKLGYTPNGLARAMRTGQTGNIGLVVPRKSDGEPITDTSFYALIVEGVEHELLNNGHNILISAVWPPEMERRDIPRIAAARFVDGLLMLGFRDTDYIEEVARQYGRVVAIDTIPTADYAAVYTANREGGRLAAEHLLRLGHRRFAMVMQTGSRNLAMRAAGFKETVETGGGQVLGQFEGEAWSDDSRAVENGIRSCIGEVSALFCGNDNLAACAIRVLSNEGVRVPETMSVVGFDGMDWTEQLIPPLTTVAVDKRRLGRTAARLLLDSLAGQPADRTRIELPVSLAERSSTAPPPT